MKTKTILAVLLGLVLVGTAAASPASHNDERLIDARLAYRIIDELDRVGYLTDDEVSAMQSMLQDPRSATGYWEIIQKANERYTPTAESQAEAKAFADSIGVMWLMDESAIGDVSTAYQSGAGAHDASSSGPCEDNCDRKKLECYFDCAAIVLLCMAATTGWGALFCIAAGAVCYTKCEVEESACLAACDATGGFLAATLPKQAWLPDSVSVGHDEQAPVGVGVKAAGSFTPTEGIK